MTTEYSIQKMVSDGTLSTITLGIQYLQRNDIYVRIAGVETPQSGAPSGYTWYFIDNTTLKILPVVPNGVEVVVYRRTDVDAMYNIYSQNAQFDEATIDENNQQLLYIAQEYLEQGIPGAGVDIIEFIRDDGSFTYYRIKRTDGSYSEEFTVPSASNSTKVLTRESLRRSYVEVGYSLVDGSFEAGGTLTGVGDVLLHEASGKAYSWRGSYPLGVYIVPPSSSPSEASWVDVSPLEPGAGTVRDGRFALRDWVSVMDFGAKGDGVTDDRAAIQAALDYIFSRGGGTVHFPKAPSFYNIASTHPDHPDSALVVHASGADFYDSGLIISGDSEAQEVILTVPVKIHSMIRFVDGYSSYVQIKDITFKGGTDSSIPKCDYVLYAADYYHPNMTLDTCRFYIAQEACMRVATFVASFKKVTCAYSKIGFHIEGEDLHGIDVSLTTSLTMASCYSLNHSVAGYRFGYMTYSSLHSCACDAVTGYAYEFGIVRGVSMIACGAEGTRQLIKVASAHGFSATSFMALACGDNASPPSSLITIEAGSSSFITGLVLDIPKAYGKKLALTGNSWGSECVVIGDSSITPDEVSYVSNFTFEKPIKFVVYDKTNKDETYTIANKADMIAVLSKLSEIEINHNISINLPNSDIVIDEFVTGFSKARGVGTVSFNGGGASSRIVVAGNGQFNIQATPVRIYFKNTTLFMNSITTGQGFNLFGSNIYLVNTDIKSHNGFVQWGLGETTGLHLDANSTIETPSFVISNGYHVLVESGTTPPAGAGYPLHSRARASDPNATRSGWVYVSGSGWVPTLS